MRMDNVTVRERVTIKDIQLILGLKRARAEQIYSSIRQAIMRKLDIDPANRKDVYVFVNDLVERYPSLDSERVMKSMAQLDNHNLAKPGVLESST
jgi:hypothetical protein